MIYCVIIVKKTTGRKIASYDYWTYKITSKQIKKYLSLRDEVSKNSRALKTGPIAIDNFKFISCDCTNDILLIFVCNVIIPDGELIDTIGKAEKVMRKAIAEQSQQDIKRDFFKLIDQLVLTRLVIALVGDSGVEKTSLLHLLTGRRPPKEHRLTIVVNTELIENIRFANHQIVIIDYAGQEKSRKLWDFSNADMIFLITDSTLKNLIVSKGLISQIKKQRENVPIYVFANKQDLPNSLDPSAIGKVLGIEAESMVAVDLAYRNNLMKSLVRILCNYFDVEVPQILPDELFGFDSD